MIAEFESRTRCLESLAPVLDGLSESVLIDAAPLRAINSLGAQLPGSVGDYLDFLRLERYQQQVKSGSTSPESSSLMRKFYYAVRPLLPVVVRKHLQRMALRGWNEIPFPRWPVETAVEDIEAAIWIELMRITGSDRLPFIWYWPDGYRIGAILTHDVETEKGRDFCGQLIEIEAEYGFSSCFEVVPEERYEVSDYYLRSLRDFGCEVALHGLNHDGHLFDDEEIFSERAERINFYLEKWGVRGFRSPIMYRRQEWLHLLNIDYDMSVPNGGWLDPQRGGCCTVRPYLVNGVLELPLTTIQDYSLLAVLNDSTPNIWWNQLEIISEHGGLASFIIHPDYMTSQRGQGLYRQLLERLFQLRETGEAWVGLPSEVCDWWHKRKAMELLEESGELKIVGEGSERACLAWAVRTNEGIKYEITTK